MKLNLNPKMAFWGICLIALAWLAASVIFEMHLGMPATGLQWAKRIVGWGVECWLLRSLVLGVNRVGSLRPKPMAR